MADNKMSRRKFMRDSAVAAAGIAAGLGAVATQNAQAAPAKPLNTSKILNYNENMEYRRLGRTSPGYSPVGPQQRPQRTCVLRRDRHHPHRWPL